MNKIRLPLENDLNGLQAYKLLKEVRTKKARIFIGCPFDDYSIVNIRPYGKHHFLAVYTERNWWKYGYIINMAQAIDLITQGIGQYKGIGQSYGLTHPEDSLYTTAEVIGRMRDFIVECREKLAGFLYCKSAEVKEREFKQACLF
jgi:hypothetical protein